ncbi:hypothetical protein N7G274_000716 [Stereocaulon virgatum]|uniref:Uncharacterized protein n=1 Tax=Stereocaulon virgatum TaxID=373712 RepID=A0ABR4ASP8_9LECA
MPSQGYMARVARYALQRLGNMTPLIVKGAMSCGGDFAFLGATHSDLCMLMHIGTTVDNLEPIRVGLAVAPESSLARRLTLLAVPCKDSIVCCDRITVGTSELGHCRLCT